MTAPGPGHAGCTAASNDWCADGGDLDPPRIAATRDSVATLVMCDPASTYGLTLPGDRQPRRLRVAGGAPEWARAGRGRLRRRRPRHRRGAGHGDDADVHRGGATSCYSMHAIARDRRPERLPVPPEARRDQPSGGCDCRSAATTSEVSSSRARRWSGRTPARPSRALRGRARTPGECADTSQAEPAAPGRVPGVRRHLGQGRPRERLPPRHSGRSGPRAHRLMSSTGPCRPAGAVPFRTASHYRLSSAKD